MQEKYSMITETSHLTKLEFQKDMVNTCFFFQVPADVHKLFSVKDYEPVVVCENGAVGFLGGSIKEECEKSVLSASQSITWCSAVELKHGIYVVYTSMCEVRPG